MVLSPSFGISQLSKVRNSMRETSWWITGKFKDVFRMKSKQKF